MRSKDPFCFSTPSAVIPNAQCHAQAYCKFWGSNSVPHSCKASTSSSELSPPNPSTRLVKIWKFVFKILLKNGKDAKGWKLLKINLVQQKRKKCERENERGSPKFAILTQSQSYKMSLIETHTNLLMLCYWFKLPVWQHERRASVNQETWWVTLCLQPGRFRRVISLLHFRKKMASLHTALQNSTALPRFTLWDWSEY